MKKAKKSSKLLKAAFNAGRLEGFGSGLGKGMVVGAFMHDAFRKMKAHDILGLFTADEMEIMRQFTDKLGAFP